MPQPSKTFKTHGEQIALLRCRGMQINDVAYARRVLERVNYYRFSGYWYSFRQLDSDGRHRLDVFVDGTNFTDVAALYDFDERLRSAVFDCLTPVELALKAMLGHELGRLDPLVHLRPALLGPGARQKRSAAKPSQQYQMWLDRYNKELSFSREDFVKHHQRKYGGQLPIWAAVEVMDWGSLAYLYRLSPIAVCDVIAARMKLTAAQLGSWIRALNIVRNYSAHHARMFNRVYTLKPRLPKVETHPELAAAKKGAQPMLRSAHSHSVLAHCSWHRGSNIASAHSVNLSAYTCAPHQPHGNTQRLANAASLAKLDPVTVSALTAFGFELQFVGSSRKISRRDQTQC